MIKVLFETHHLYYLPNFLPIVDEFKNRGNYDIYFSMPQHINQRERDLFSLACKDLGLNTIYADDEELRTKKILNENFSIILVANVGQITRIASDNTLTVMVYHGIGLKQSYYNDIDDRIDIIATDHAPHTIDEKNNTYFKAPSGGPLVQHALVAMLEFYHQGKVGLEWIVKKMCHAPATCFQVKERGFIREGYYADLVVVDLDKPWVVKKDNILYQCGWSPFEGETFKSSVVKTFVNGNLVYDGGVFDESHRGMRLEFDRNV